MNDAFLVRELECAGDVTKDARGVGDRHCAGAQQAHAQRLAFDEGHRVVGKSVRIAGAENGNDMRMLKSRCEQDLALESLGAQAGGEIGRQDLDDDAAGERTLLGGEDATHPAAPKLALERISAAQVRLQLVPKLCVQSTRWSEAPKFGRMRAWLPGPTSGA